MPDERSLQAIDRIERALARIEAAAQLPQSAPQPQDDSALLALRETHQALRSKVEGAISQIDRLLVMNERG